MLYVGSQKYKLYVGSERRQIVASNPLPYDAEVEYIGFTGTQYINTLLLPDVLDFNIIYESYNNIRYGWIAQNNGNGTWICSTSASVFYKTFSQRYNITNSAPNNWDVWRYDMTNGFYRNNNLLKGFSVLLGNTQISQIPLYIGQPYDATASAVDTNTTGFDQRIKTMQIYRNGVLARDYIPVRVGQTGYLYDKVSGTLFGNAGTGDFIIGNDVN